MSHQIVLVLVPVRHSGGKLVEWTGGISTEGAQEMQKGSCRFSVLGSRYGRTLTTEDTGGHGGRLRASSSVEPLQEAALEFLRGGAYGSAVVGAGNFPELCVGSTGVNGFGVADGNVAVDLAVDEKNRNSCRCDGVLGRKCRQVEVVLPTRSKKRDFDQRAENCSSDPRAEVKGLSHAIVGDLSERGERRFDGDGAEVWVRVEGLEKLRGAHRFGEGEDTAMTVRE